MSLNEARFIPRLLPLFLALSSSSSAIAALFGHNGPLNRWDIPVWYSRRDATRKLSLSCDGFAESKTMCIFIMKNNKRSVDGGYAQFLFSLSEYYRGNRLIKASLIDFVNWSKNTSILANNFYSLNVWLSETEFYTCSDILASMLLFLCLKGRSSITWSSMLENLGRKIRIHINLGNVICSQGTRYILKDYEWDKNCPITRDQRITSPCLKKITNSPLIFIHKLEQTEERATTH